MSYAELHALSNFSFLRGASHPQELVAQARDLRYSALAITDECSMAGVVRAWDEAKKTGFPLIIGSEFRLDGGLRLVLLAESYSGYSQLCQLITQARRRGAKGSYRLAREDCGELRDCVALWLPGKKISDADAVRSTSAGLSKQDAAAAWWVREQFGDKAWIAVELHRGPRDLERLAELQALSRCSGMRLVAAGDVHMHAPERRPLQDTLTAIRHGCTLAAAGYRLFPNGERHLRPMAALREVYPPELLRETLEISQRCRFRLEELRNRYQYPHELVPEGLSPSAHLRQFVFDGARRRWPGGIPADVLATLEKELALIAELEYESYFLTVEDIVRYARSQNILCQGRGSAANSMVCYALGVTEVGARLNSMLFERFVSRERHEPPDIDIDFEHSRREEVIQYIYDKYGRDRAALAATLITYKPRSAIRDVGKALGLSLDQVDALAKSLHWFDDLKEMHARLREVGLDPDAPVIRRLLGLVVEIIGFPRHLSQHVGGFVISQAPLHSLVPVENAAMKDRTVIQWDKDDLESLGLLKVDVLALGMLTALRESLALLAKRDGRPFGMSDIPEEDAETYKMLCKGQAIGVFQVESRAQMSMLPRLRPKEFYDLVIQIAIVRPGPIQGDMVHPYLSRRKNPDKVEYPSDELKNVLQRTLGVPLFQEQVMQIAIVAAGFTPGEADQVRRSMAAWQKSGGLTHFRDKLIAGMLKKKYSLEFAERIYKQILGFGSYGFPESHSASFALLAYKSAWLRCHEHAAFTAGLLNAQPMGFYQPAQLINDARHHGVEVRGVDALVSAWDCTLEPGAGSRCAKHECRPLETECGGRSALRLGLRLIKGLSKTEGDRLIAARAGRSFASADELCAAAQLSRRAINALAEADALAGIAGHRHQARWSALGIEKLPGLIAGRSANEISLALPPPSEAQEITADYNATGLTLRRHPLAVLRPRFKRLGVLRSDELAQHPTGRHVRIAGLVTHRQRPGTASGVLFISLEDEAGIANLILHNSVQEQQRAAVLGSKLMVVAGELQNEQGVIHVLAGQVRNYNRWLGNLDIDSRDFQ